MPAKPLAALALALAASLGAAGCRAGPDEAALSAKDRDTGVKPALGLMTSLPLIWGEAADIGEVLDAQGEPSWVRRALERRYRLEPLDALDDAGLARLDRLMLAQPRALSPAENVALDAWVRRGGKLLLFADPMLTRPSRFALGDRRRPQDVVLLSPILTHWGLALRFDEGQRPGARQVAIGEVPVPVHLAGTLTPRPAARCAIEAETILARCPIGEGLVIVLADAAMLDDDSAAIGEAALEALLDKAFGAGDAGISRDLPRS